MDNSHVLTQAPLHPCSTTWYDVENKEMRLTRFLETLVEVVKHHNRVDQRQDRHE
jgi:hypothetical protein